MPESMNSSFTSFKPKKKFFFEFSPKTQFLAQYLNIMELKPCNQSF